MVALFARVFTTSLIGWPGLPNLEVSGVSTVDNRTGSVTSLSLDLAGGWPWWNLVEEGEGWLELTFTGSGFLYKMVRFLVGSAVRVAQGKLDPKAVATLLKGRSDSEKAPYCAPADGLLLVSVQYDGEPMEGRDGEAIA